MVGVQSATKVDAKFLHAKEVAEILGISETTAYRRIKELNDELKVQGYIVVPGKISKRYLKKKHIYKKYLRE